MKERESWFDFLRGVAVLMVIAIHTFAATSQKEEMVGDALIVSRQMNISKTVVKAVAA